MRAPETGLMDTISAKVLMIEMMMSPAQMNAITHPRAPEMPIRSPDETNKPMPTVPEIPIAMQT